MAGQARRVDADLYEHSLSLTFGLLFLVSFTLHGMGGLASTTRATGTWTTSGCARDLYDGSRSSGSSPSRTGRASSSHSWRWSRCPSSSGSADHRSQSRWMPPCGRRKASDYRPTHVHACGASSPTRRTPHSPFTIQTTHRHVLVTCAVRRLVGSVPSAPQRHKV